MTKRRKLPWKAVFLLPVVALPVAAALFYGLGGGQPDNETDKVRSGLNKELPGSMPANESPLDKLSIYKLAEKDSLKRMQEQASDPVFAIDTLAAVVPLRGHDNFPLNGTKYEPYRRRNVDPNEARIHQKLSELERQLQTPSTEEHTFLQQKATPSLHSPLPEVAPLPAQASQDPELAEIDKILEKVLDVQHPERITRKLQEQSVAEKGKVFPLTPPSETPVTDLLLPPVDNDSSVLPISRRQQLSVVQFYEWSEEIPVIAASNAVRAVVHETSTVVSGATIKLRLEQDLFIQGIRIPTGHFVYGKGNLSGDRYTIAINAIRYQSSVYPVNLEVIGMDGISGIYIENAISRQVLRSGADQNVQGIQLATMDPSLKAQAAAGAVETAKNLLSRKMKLTTVTLKAGEPVLLRDSNQQ